MSPRDLPVWQLHSEILGTLRHGSQLVLIAATGSGKTTQVPQMLLDGGIAGNQRLVILQPRRVAARSVAHRVAWERRGDIGQEVGYQVRFEDHIADHTRICFVTEGILLRWMQDDPALSDVGVLIFDEFHERNLLSDVALALARRLQQTTRPDLKMLVMSATLEAEPVARYLAGNRDSTPAGPAAPVLVSEGRAYPVDLRWAEYGDRRPAPEQAADAVERLVNGGAEGDILVFMPGMGEINSTVHALRAARLKEPCVFLPLHGDLPADEQDRAFASFTQRKIVVATNVAETSITIDGVRQVVDSGLARIARYDAERGIQTLALEPISRASADQRAGRAGRTAPGTCWRLWTESAHLDRPARNTPEIQRADLAEVVLLLHSLGIRKAAEFDWLDRPDPAAVERAERLLVTLGALLPLDRRTEDGGPRTEVEMPPSNDPSSVIRHPSSDLTPDGRQMLRLPMHPRYSRMLVEASRRDCVPAAALCAALTSGRDLLVRLGRDDTHVKEARELFEASRESDFHTLMRAFEFARQAHFDVQQCRRLGIHAQTARQVEDTYRQLMSLAEREGLVRRSPTEPESASTPNIPPTPTRIESSAKASSKPLADPLLICLTAGFIDQLAVRKDGGTLDCRLPEGRTGSLVRESLVDSPLMVAGTLREVEGRNGRVTLLSLATAVRTEWLTELYPQHLSQRRICEVDRLHKRVAALRETLFLDLVLRREHEREVDPVAAGKALADAFSAGWFELPNLDHRIRQFIARVNLLNRTVPELEVPRFDGRALRAALSRALHGLTLIKEAQTADLMPAFVAQLQPAQLAFLNELLPPGLSWSGGPKLKLTYPESAEDSDDKEPPGPEAQVKLTDCLGLKEHPRVAEGRVPVTFILLAPDQKRLGTTTDMPGWRQKTYPGLRTQLRQKYPGVPWP